MTQKGDNKIGIPWYRRNVSLIGNLNDMGQPPISLDLPNIRPRTNPRTRTQSVRQPSTVPVTQPTTQPVTAPNMQPDFNPNPFPFPIPPIIPGREPNKNPNQNPIPQNPAFPPLAPIPQWMKDPNYNWANHFQQNLESIKAAAPTSEKTNPLAKTVTNILRPIVALLVLDKKINDYLKVTVGDPIYAKMLADPALGTVLREAEKANMDAETVGTILANFDWENGDYNQLQESLALGIGVAGAARLLVFIIGRKILFRL